MKSVIPLGECPFCGGGVTVGVDEYDSETGMVYFSYGDRPRCENGCPVGRFDNQRCHFYGIWVTAEKDAAPVFRECWKKEVEALRNHPACPDCGKPADFKSDGKDFLILGCPHCRLWAKKARPSPGSWTNGASWSTGNARKTRGRTGARGWLTCSTDWTNNAARTTKTHRRKRHHEVYRRQGKP